MKRIQKLIVCSLVALIYSVPAHADIEAITATIKGGVTGVQTEIKKLQDLQTSVTKLKDTTEQGFNTVTDKINEVKDVAANPTGMVMGEVMKGLQGASDGSVPEDEAMEDVKKTYNRVYGEEDNIRQSRKIQIQVNKLQGENSARLFAKSLVLRQELLAEENPDHKLDTIDDALKASNEMLIQSTRRWNKILEMQAHINEYKGTLPIQNFPLEQEEAANE